MLKTDIHKFLDGYRITNDNLDISKKHNVLSQPGLLCKPGKWFIPDNIYCEFLKKIGDTLVSNEKIELHFLEVPNTEFNMVKIDIDLRFNASEEEIKQKTECKRRYTNELIELMITILAENLKEIIEVPETYKIYVQEKLNQRILYQEKEIKDGIHIIIPELVLSNQALYYLREQIINNDSLQEYLNKIQNKTDISDVIDKRIIYPNAWFVYGCGKPDDKKDVYKVSKIYKIVDSMDTFEIKLCSNKGDLQEYIPLFSNYGKKENVKYCIELNDARYSNDKNSKYIGKETEAIYRVYAQDQNNFRRASALTQEEIEPYLDCLKHKRVDDYDDWCHVGLSLFNMDHRNFDLWNKWSSQSSKYNEQYCRKKWYVEFPKAGKYNMGFSKIKEYAKQDNIEKYRKIININKKNFFHRWIHAHIQERDIHGKGLSISTITTFIHSYIIDYASFNVACALPGCAKACVFYKFDKHKWSKDEGANKVYNLLSDTIKNELNEIYFELKDKLIAIQRQEHEKTYDNKEDSLRGDSSPPPSYERFIVDNRAKPVNAEQLSNELKDKMYTKQQNEKCAELILFLSKPSNKKTVIEDLSQKCYDEEFYKKLDDNNNVFVCSNGVLDLENCVFRNGLPSDMMTMTSGVEFPKNIDTIETQEIMCSIQDWLDKIFPDDDVQAYVLNTVASKLSGHNIGEKFHIFTGSGANGKSQFFKMIKQIFGDYYLQSDNSLLNTAKGNPNGPSPAIAGLKSKRIVVMTEPKSTLPFESDKVKELVSGDQLIGRHLNKDPIQFIPQYAMILQCNDIPKNETTDDGFWRKIFIVPCESKFVIKDEDLYKLEDPVKFPNHFPSLSYEHLYKDWAPYFLYLLFERYKQLKQIEFKYPTPDKMKIATREYQAEANTYTDFFNQKVEEVPGYKVDSCTLYIEFQHFIGRDFKTNKPTFLKQMERIIGKPKGRDKEYYGFRIRGTSGEPIETINLNSSDD